VETCGVLQIDGHQKHATLSLVLSQESSDQSVRQMRFRIARLTYLDIETFHFTISKKRNAKTAPANLNLY
jgi:hypothetical protein